MKRFIVLGVVLILLAGVIGGALAHTWDGEGAEDNQVNEPGMASVPAPVESIDVVIAESWPPQYFLHIVSGLPNGCARFDRYDVIREGNTIRVEIFNLEPTDGRMCTEEYRIVEHSIPLGSDFVSGQTYTIQANCLSKSFIAQ